MRGIRFAVGAAGAALLLWGAWLLLSRQDLPQLFGVAIWLAAVVVVHDGTLAVIQRATAPPAGAAAPAPPARGLIRANARPATVHASSTCRPVPRRRTASA